MRPSCAVLLGVAYCTSACSLLAPSDEELSSQFGKVDAAVDAGSDADAATCSCELENAVGTCENGECRIEHCESGYLDVDRTDSNGCELTSPIPTDNLVLWLAADEGVEESGGKVVAWRDRSWSRYDHTQPNSSIQPTVTPAALNGRPVVDFQKQRLENGSFGGTFAEGFSLFAIVQRDASSGPPFQYGAFLDLFDNDRTNGLYFARYGNGDDFLAGYSNQPASINTTGGLFAPDTPHLIALTLGSSGHTFRWDGAPAASMANAFVPMPLFLERSYIGGNSSTLEFHDGYVAEIILYDAAISDTSVEEYLATKWGCCP